MKSTLLSRAAVPLLAFVLAFASTSGLTLWAAEAKAGKAERKLSASKAAKPAPAVEKSDEKRAPLVLKTDLEQRILQSEDVVFATKYLVRLKKGEGVVDVSEGDAHGGVDVHDDPAPRAGFRA